MATIRDVAREAGVSIATVSRVYNKTSLVSEPTVDHVRAIAARMDYWPNGAARSLITNRSHALGVVLPDLYGEFFSEVIRGIDLEARRERFHLLVSSSHADSDGLISAVRSMRGRIDGLIAMAPDPGSAAAIREMTRNFPVVLLDSAVDIADCTAISVANFEGAHELVKYLLKLGHREIGIIRGPEGNVDATERLRGFRAALSQAGVAPRPELEFLGDFTEAGGYNGAMELLKRRPRPTAVFAANDYMAIGMISAVRDSGLRVPEDLAVAGFDDIAMARYMNPPLTTVRVVAYELGQRAVLRLVPLVRTRKAGAGPPEVMPTTLVIRASCGSPQPARLEPLPHSPRRRIS